MGRLCLQFIAIIAQEQTTDYYNRGGWYYGSSAEGLYNGSFLVDRSVQMGTPIIFASFNYRLAGWGWLWSDEVVEKGLTNVGFRDQRYL